MGRPAEGSVGRPRGTTIDAQAVAATLELLEEVGYEATTMQAIAARSGLHTSALYRRWRSRTELIEAVVSPILTAASWEPSGDLERDLRRFLRAYEATFTAPAGRAAIPGLMAHYRSHGSSRSPDEWLAISARPQFLDILRAAAPGSVDPRADPDDIFDVLLGALLARVIVPTVVDRNRPLERTVELALKMVRPRAPCERARQGGGDPA